MSGHGNGADGDASVLSVLRGIRAGLASWSWRFARAIAAPAIAGSRSMTAVRRRRAAGFRSLHEALDTINPQWYLGTRPGRPDESRASASPTETPQLRDTPTDPHKNPTDGTAHSGTLVMRVKGTENSR